MEIKHILAALKKNNVIAMLIVFQIAVTLMMVSNSIFITLATLEGWLTPTGLDEDNMVVVWNEFYDPDLNLEVQVQEDLQSLKNIPGVLDITPVLEAPFESSISFRWTFFDDSENAERFPISLLDMDENGPNVLGAELLEGRWFRPDEVAYGEFTGITPPSVVLISETLAKVMYPDDSALGKTLYLSPNGQEGAEVIGIYKDFMGGDLAVYRSVPYQTVIRPMVAWGLDYKSNYLLKVEPGMADSLLDPIEESLYQTRGRYISMSEVLSRTHKRLYDGRTGFSFTMLGISAIGLLITAMGIIGLVSLSVSQRRQQIGTRRALGATKWQVVRYFLVENTVLTTAGLLLGLAFSYGLNYLLTTEFNNPGLIKFHYWIFIALGFWILNLAAARIPAKRAAEVAPAIVTRSA